MELLKESIEVRRFLSVKESFYKRVWNQYWILTKLIEIISKPDIVCEIDEGSNITLALVIINIIYQNSLITFRSWITISFWESNKEFKWIRFIMRLYCASNNNTNLFVSKGYNLEYLLEKNSLEKEGYSISFNKSEIKTLSVLFLM